MLYHVSQVKDSKIIEPRVSTHGKAYVYAINNMVTALLFGAKKDDFDFIMDVNKDEIPVIYECYPNAFELVYNNKSCSVYELDNEGFMYGKTGWAPEMVNENAAIVRKETIVNDLYKRLLVEEEKNNLIIHRFKTTIEHKKLISNHIVDRLIRYEILDKPIVDDRFMKYFGNITATLLDLLSGKYL